MMRPLAPDLETPRVRFFPLGLLLTALPMAIAATILAPPLRGQVITIDTSGKAPVTANGTVDRQYRQVQPTHVVFSNTPMNARDKLEIVRVMQAEQGFAMRPLPAGHKGLTLEANGKLDPAGEAYLNMATANGVSVKPGGRVVITNVKIDRNKLILDLNQGPDAKHRFLRHLSVGMGGPENPVVADAPTPAGARVTLTFKKYIPELTGAQVQALLAPLISFGVKTPIQAYTDTLPKPLKQAILSHQIWVGMNIDMVMFAKGEPRQKYHEMDGQMPVDIWLYGQPPDPVTFVRINGNSVIRVEIARIGQPLQVFTKNVVAPLMSGVEGSALEAENVRIVQEGDVQRDPNTQMPAPPPTLRKPGETLPASVGDDGQVMKPVQFPSQQPEPQPDPYPNGQGTAAGAQTGQSGASAPAAAPAAGSAPGSTRSSGAQSQKPANSTQPATMGKDPDDQSN